MTRGQRRIAAVPVGLVLVASLAAAVARGGDGGRLATTAPSSTTTTTEAPGPTETTVALVPVTTGVPVPTTPTTARRAPATTVTVPATVPPGPTAGPALTAAGAVLSPPSPQGPPRSIDKAAGCHSAVDPGWKVVDCGALRTAGTVLLWVVESRGRGTRALVLREQGEGRWVVALAAHDDDGSRFSAVGVRGEDVSGDGQPELAFGFRRTTPDRVLAVDLVTPAAVVAVHVDLPGGSARLAPGELSLWRTTPAGGAERASVRWDGAAWRVTATGPVDPRALPASMI